MRYTDIPNSPDGQRTARNLLDLKSRLVVDGVPAKNPGRLLLATWNIRHFGTAKEWGTDVEAPGRTPEALCYIAEIISHFDLVAVQEVKEQLQSLDRVKDLLGPWWQYVATDVTDGKPGNRERLAFLFDTRRVQFAGISGEVVIPPVPAAGGRGKYEPANQLYRTPFLCGFTSGFSRFMLCTVHIMYGTDKPNAPKRVREIREIAQFLRKRAEEASPWSRNLVLLGDFNIFSRTDPTMAEITNAGFQVPEALQSVPATNLGSKARFYDQIALLPRDGEFEPTQRAGVFDFFNSVYKEPDQETYVSAMGTPYVKTSKRQPRTDRGKRTYYLRTWRTNQMSDHLPMWLELRVDYSAEYLGKVTRGEISPPAP